MSILDIPDIMGCNLTTHSTKLVTFTDTLLCRKKGNIWDREGAKSSKVIYWVPAGLCRLQKSFHTPWRRCPPRAGRKQPSPEFYFTHSSTNTISPNYIENYYWKRISEVKHMNLVITFYLWPRRITLTFWSFSNLKKAPKTPRKTIQLSSQNWEKH